MWLTTRTLVTIVAVHTGRSFRTGFYNYSMVLLTAPSHSVLRDHSYGCEVQIRQYNLQILTSLSNKRDFQILPDFQPLHFKAETVFQWHAEHLAFPYILLLAVRWYGM